VQRRRLNRLLLEALYPGCLRPVPPLTGLEPVLRYVSRGEFLGVLGQVRGQPRSATCVADVLPPAFVRDGGKLKYEESGDRIELVRIPRADFEHLCRREPSIAARAAELVHTREGQDQERQGKPRFQAAGGLVTSPEFGELGLAQGQRLMLIDLDRCTRCDECVRACIDTHADGRTRLFLDGPRFGHYLVPTTCRSCRDPVCMIGCPVGSIHRGPRGEIRIEDWCIGCSRCANQCPYGSIQMHDIGLIAEGAHGWRYQTVGRDACTRLDYHAAGWYAGRAPFVAGLDFLASLQGLAPHPRPGEPVCFRYPFVGDAARLERARGFEIELASADETAEVWLNGEKLEVSEKARRGKRTFPIPAGQQLLRPGRNVVAALVKPTAEAGATLLDLRLDVEQEPEAPDELMGGFSQKVVDRLAVVCDLCSSVPGQRPACVRACPHDAAFRVDALMAFPAK
jgi:Fe-S-cluster-containing hydrogenase component 2